MKFNDNPVMILLGIILAVLGALSFFGYKIFPTNQVMIIAVFVLAGLVIFLVLAGSVKENVGMIVTALWLLLMGLIAQFTLVFSYSDLILSILPLAAGAFMLLGM